jgi:hypothetical protein
MLVFGFQTSNYRDIVSPSLDSLIRIGATVLTYSLSRLVHSPMSTYLRIRRVNNTVCIASSEAIYQAQYCEKDHA